MSDRRFDDYIEVNERIIAFYAKYPEGSLQAEIHTLTDNLVVMQAWAYRTPDDKRPSMGWSSMSIPGATNFTRGSEIENCAKYLGKGSSVFVEGRLQTRSWETDGQKHWKTEVVADRVNFLDGRRDAEADTSYVVEPDDMPF